MKIGKCRVWYSEQLLLLELLIKIHSYSSGNRRNFRKMSGFEKKCVILHMELIFQLWFFSSFFSIPITFTNFLGPLSSHFFDFLFYIPGNCILIWEVETNFRKIKKCVILRMELIFQFWFYSIFFSIPITFTNFLGPLSDHFFDFLSYMAGKCIFWCQI